MSYWPQDVLVLSPSAEFLALDGASGALEGAAEEWGSAELAPVVMVGESQNPVYLSTSIGTDSGRALRHKSDSGAYVDCQIAINPVTVTSGWDLQSVLTHEIGHCLGMPDKRDDDDGELTMYFQLWKNSTHQRTLEARDIAEANMLYTGVVAPGCAIGHGNPALGIIFAALAAVLLTRRTHASFRKSR